MSDGSDGATVQRQSNDAKSYETPTLRKGPLLSRAIAAPGPSTVLESDTRLKRDIHAIGRLASGLTLYRFRYLWTDIEMVGVMAQEVLKVTPDAVIMGEDGYYRVDYERLDLRFMTYAEWLAEPALANAA